ncbi:MAG TPA: UDP-N-acetylmuramate dehydrogenase [Methylomirabilota bacterium]|nr:UDP-N-acetylmuramate dehydrogenase [Methylomirabilota bacterium]
MNTRLHEIPALMGEGSVVRFNEPMARHTTLRVGGPADCWVEPGSEQALSVLLRFCAEAAIPFLVVGRGSNLLVRDGGIRGVVICLSQPAFSQVVVVGNELHCGAGARLKQVANEAKRQGLTGLEFLEGIPGSIGGALRMNAGAMARATFDAVKRVRYMNIFGAAREIAREDLRVEYRKCEFLKHHLAIGAVLAAEPAPREVIETRMNEYSRKRWDSQPAAPSAGCIFKNSPTVPSGKLVQELGLKGLKIGGAAVSDVHGNFIVNEGGATAADVLRLIRVIKQRARDDRSIELETEVEIVGEPGSAEESEIPDPAGELVLI